MKPSTKQIDSDAGSEERCGRGKPACATATPSVASTSSLFFFSFLYMSLALFINTKYAIPESGQPSLPSLDFDSLSLYLPMQGAPVSSGMRDQATSASSGRSGQESYRPMSSDSSLDHKFGLRELARVGDS